MRTLGIIAVIAVGWASSTFAQEQGVRIVPQIGCNGYYSESLVNVYVDSLYPYAEPAALNALLNRAKAEAFKECPDNELVSVSIYHGPVVASIALTSRFDDQWSFAQNDVIKLAKEESLLYKIILNTPDLQHMIAALPIAFMLLAIPVVGIVLRRSRGKFQIANSPTVKRMTTRISENNPFQKARVLMVTLIEKWREHRESKRIERERAEAARQAAAAAAWEASPEGRAAAARAKRLQEEEKLKAKLLHPPPERLAATIKIWEKDYTELQSTISDILEDINSGYKSFVVDLYLVPSEEERQIITTFKLQELILDDEPRYTAEELNSYAKASATTNADIGRMSARYAEAAHINEQLDDWHREFMQQRRAARHYTRLEDFFNFPHSRSFASSHEAHTYAVRLREELLPKVRKFIEDYRDRKTEETFTV